MINGLGREAGQALVEHPGVDKISFTGRTIMEAAKRDMNGVVLELGCAFRSAAAATSEQTCRSTGKKRVASAQN